MTIIKPMKDGPLVAQGIPNLKDPVGTDVKPEKPAFGLYRFGQSKTNRFVMDHIPPRGSARIMAMQSFEIRQFSTRARLQARV